MTIVELSSILETLALNLSSKINSERKLSNILYNSVLFSPRILNVILHNTLGILIASAVCVCLVLMYSPTLFAIRPRCIKARRITYNPKRLAKANYFVASSSVNSLPILLTVIDCRNLHTEYNPHQKVILISLLVNKTKQN